MIAPDCFVACRHSHAGETCRCENDAPPARPNSLRPTTILSRVNGDRCDFPLDAVDLSAPISNAIVMLCMQALR